MLPMDELSGSIRPQDDLWGFVNGAWLAGDPIPVDRARWGLSDQKRDRISRLLEGLVTAADVDAPSAEERAVARLHASYLDVDGRARAGTAAIDDELAAINGVTSVAELLWVLGQRQREGVPGLCTVSTQPDVDDPTRWAVHLFQGGLSLPSPQMYPRLGADLADTAARLIVGAGLPRDTATRAMDLEVSILEAGWDRPYGDDDRALTNRMTWDQLSGSLGVELAPWLRGLGLAHAERAPLNVCQPSFWEGLGQLLRTRPLDEWRAWASWRVVCERAPLLTPDLEEVHHRFFVQQLRGQPEPTPRWRRAVEVVQLHCGPSLGRLFTERHLDPEVKAATRALAERVRHQLRESLLQCQWLTSATRATAVDKLDRMVLNIGWPDRWPAAPDVDRTAQPVAHVRRTAALDTDQLAARLRGPVDRSLWGPPPFVVNTFYHPLLNQLTVEGASLPPADTLDDLAVLCGQYASIIGHELGHAFDSRGSHRDPDGIARTWWTDEERTAFDARAARVVAQVDGYRPRGVHDRGLDGRLVGFEVVAELIGYHAAWDTYAALTTEAQRRSTSDGFTGAQRFFLAKAYGRRAADRPAAALARLESDVHPPFEVFANLAANLDAFHDAFGTRPGDALWRDPDERVRIF